MSAATSGNWLRSLTFQRADDPHPRRTPRVPVRRNRFHPYNRIAKESNAHSCTLSMNQVYVFV